MRLYDAWGKPDKAKEWRAKLGVNASDLPLDVFWRLRLDLPGCRVLPSPDHEVVDGDMVGEPVNKTSRHP